MVLKLTPLITPIEVAELINFDAVDPGWHYKPEDSSMAAKQAEGVAGLWNLLSKRRLALLADEVGMGKTYQAMGVMLRLWLDKPKARILVMAPNHTLCNNWKTEFATFSQKHYRKEFQAKNYEPQIHGRLVDLAAAVQEKPHPFYLTTIHALSGLVPQDEKEDGYNAAARYGALYRRKIKQALGGGFDLIIVDEAHYFRNRHGDSQRAAAAQAFFGNKQERLGSNVLLLTATPNHSSPRNVYDIFSYFIEIPERYAKDDVRGLMQDFAIRRLRKMQGLSKYAYRNERAIATSFSGQADAELFFALYQKQLVTEMSKQGTGRRMLYGYLEGFESTGSRVTEYSDKDEQIHDDFNKAFDSELLSNLTRQFQDIYHRLPDHPKYDQLVNACISDDPFKQGKPLYSSKHLVFVRRIPSVREITQRINARYDEIMAERLIKVWQLPDEALREWSKTGWKREKFMDLISTQISNRLSPDELSFEQSAEDIAEDANEEKLSSKIADLFVVKKSGMRSTDCSNVSLRFRRSESLFSLFLEPARDGINANYVYYYRHEHGIRERDSYGDAARDARIPSQSSVKHVTYQQPLPTAWGLMFEMLPESARQQLKRWRSEPNGEKIIENFAHYLRTGYLFASPVMIEIYCWFTEFNRGPQKSDVQQRYLHFIECIMPKLGGSLMLRYFAAAIETFETLCEKIVGQPLDNSDYTWRELSSLSSPGMYASGQSPNRERLIRGFNSPFFPNVLVATSVLQEGVNLHLECYQVHHYGIAWTPGDNEQRNGRVDRLFGRVNTMLKEKSGQAEMIINYPYLEGTFDQDQLASFIRHKYIVEEKLDSCESQEFDSEIDLCQDTQGWKSWLRQPHENKFLEDPFPAKFKPE